MRWERRAGVAVNGIGEVVAGSERSEMLGSYLKKVFGSSNDRRLKGYRPKVAAVNALEPEFAALSDEQLRGKTDEFRAAVAAGKSLDELAAPAFAAVREAAKRTLKQRHFDVQLIGGLVLHEGAIAEMRTGEGKTLVATLACYLNALAGKGVHVVTVNDYLARRDSEWMGEIHKFLGMSVGVIVHGLDDEERRQAYAADITYGTNNEFGFDYLRDNMKYDMAQMVQRGHNFAIVDEVDSILVDEARTPLIISGPSEDRSGLYVGVDALIPQLKREDYEIDEKQRTVNLTEVGNERVEALLRAAGLLKEGFALRGRQRDPRPSRQSGVARAQAVPARQGLYRSQRRSRHRRRIHRPHDARPALFGGAASGARSQGEASTVQPENVTLASITFQNYFRLYKKLAGHDRHGGDRGRRIRRDLQTDRRRNPDASAGQPPRRGRRGLSHRRGEAARGGARDRGSERQDAADAGRHDLDREVGAIGRRPRAPRLQEDRLHPAGRDDRALRRGARRQAVEEFRHPQRAPPRAGGVHRRGGRRSRRDHHRHQHGRPRHRHSARRQRRDARQAGTRPGGLARGARRQGSGHPRRGRRLQAEGDRGRRALYRRHRASREPAHRQPVARPLGAPGRPRPLQVLPVAAGRPDAHFRLRAHGRDAQAPRAPGGRGDRPSRGSTRRWRRRSRRSKRATSTSARTFSSSTT